MHWGICSEKGMEWGEAFIGGFTKQRGNANRLSLKACGPHKNVNRQTKQNLPMRSKTTEWDGNWPNCRFDSQLSGSGRSLLYPGTGPPNCFTNVVRFIPSFQSLCPWKERVVKIKNVPLKIYYKAALCMQTVYVASFLYSLTTYLCKYISISIAASINQSICLAIHLFMYLCVENNSLNTFIFCTSHTYNVCDVCV